MLLHQIGQIPYSSFQNCKTCNKPIYFYFLRSSFILESPSEKIFYFSRRYPNFTLHKVINEPSVFFSKPRFSCNYQGFQIGATSSEPMRSPQAQEPIRMHHFGKPTKIVLRLQRTKLEMYIAYVKYELGQKFPDLLVMWPAQYHVI